ncbi:MAG: hypothetical protein HY665_00070 [Chloroflexi bacterium]|nr:hypothetical protein [Chloroflexota bacterium]
MNTTVRAPRRSQQLMNHDVQLWRQAKAAAVLKGQTITEWVEDVIRKELAATKKRAA